MPSTVLLKPAMNRSPRRIGRDARDRDRGPLAARSDSSRCRGCRAGLRRPRVDDRGGALSRVLKPSALELLDESLLQFVPDAPKVAVCCSSSSSANRRPRRAASWETRSGPQAVRESRRDGGQPRRTREAVERAARGVPRPRPAPPTQRSLQLIEDGLRAARRAGCLRRRTQGCRRSSRHSGRDLWARRGRPHPRHTLPDTTRDGWREALRGLFDEVTDLAIRLGVSRRASTASAGCARASSSASTARR